MAEPYEAGYDTVFALPAVDDDPETEIGVLLMGFEPERLLAGLGVASRRLADDAATVTTYVDQLRHDASAPSRRVQHDSPRPSRPLAALAEGPSTTRYEMMVAAQAPLEMMVAPQAPLEMMVAPQAPLEMMVAPQAPLHDLPPPCQRTPGSTDSRPNPPGRGTSEDLTLAEALAAGARRWHAAGAGFTAVRVPPGTQSAALRQLWVSAAAGLAAAGDTAPGLRTASDAERVYLVACWLRRAEITRTAEELCPT